MKISCLTFHDSSNYGTVMQAYALQTIVTRMGMIMKSLIIPMLKSGSMIPS